MLRLAYPTHLGIFCRCKNGGATRNECHLDNFGHVQAGSHWRLRQWTDSHPFTGYAGSKIDPVRSVDNFLRMLKAPTVTTITTGNYSLLYSPEQGQSKLYDLSLDPGQQKDIISDRPDVAKALHQCFVNFMRDTDVPAYLLKPRLQLFL